jgi:acetoin utilization deacetylase AcuC-like enzyme
VITGYLYEPAFLEHDTGPGHPETAARLTAVMTHLAGEAWFAGLKRVPAVRFEPEWIEPVHSLDYLRRAEQACRSGAPFLDTLDVAISPDSFDAALLAAGAGIALAEAMIAGRIDNGFALVRPPGHHAETARAAGFCLFNNVAVLARHLQRRHGLDKIAIVDWDVHHGNGTQHTFEEDPSVMYVSTHQYPYYPGTGAASETGRGRGAGATVNCPMPAGATDSAYERAFMEVILPALQRFRPEALLVSAGFDAHRDDPLAQIELSTGFFGWMSLRLMEIADQYSGGRLLSLLEGGYNLRVLPLCVAEHLKVLAGVTRV